MIITDELFATCIPDEFHNFVVALSGGADSLCLTLLLNKFCQNNNYKIAACIVDHKLRPESSSELIPIIKILEDNDIEHKIMVWQHSDITGSIELKARKARYELLLEYCGSRQSNCLCTAHHGLDQWETFFMRLSRGSGLKGLTGIHTITNMQNIKILRPLLKFRPEDIKQTLIEQFGYNNYVRDSMNYDKKYERVRWRQSYELLSKYLDIKHINLSITRLQRANDCINEVTKQYFEMLFDGTCLKLNEFSKLHLELQCRILEMIVRYFNPNKQIISYDLLERMAQKITSNKTVNFCSLIFKYSKKNIKIFKEGHRPEEHRSKETSPQGAPF